MISYAIARERYKDKRHIQQKISPEEWEQFVDSKPDIFWLEDTDLGRNMPATNARFRLKRSARAEWDSRRGYYHIQLTHYDEGYVSITLNSVATLKRLQYLHDLATALNAFFLKDGTKIIDQAFIEAYKNKRAKKNAP